MEQRLTIRIEMGNCLPANPLVANGDLRPEMGHAGGDSSCKALTIPSYELVPQSAVNNVVIGSKRSCIVVDDRRIEIVGPPMMERCARPHRASPAAIIGEDI